MEENKQDNVLRFEASAYLQRLIGRELISTEYAAVAELVKNAYDAKARKVVVQLNKEPPQRMLISDDGVGMSLKEFRRLWMMPGYSEKLQADVAEDRPVLGEKGIGRFAADKLARRLTVVTKKALEEEALVVGFDWDQFEDRASRMRDIPIRFTHRPDSELAEYRSGTRLELSSLRKEWERADWVKLRRELQTLVSPFKSVRGFKIIANAPGWESGEVKSVFEAQPGYQYTFSLTKGGYFRWKLSRPRRVVKSLDKPAEETKRKKYGTTSFGPIRGEFYYVDRPGSLKKQGFEPGIGVYRDGFRVEPYGRRDDDWLQVKSRKASRHGHAPISPSKLFGFVEITRADNAGLKDVTNREGLLDSREFRAFHKFVLERFKDFSQTVQREKDDLEATDPAIEAQRKGMTRETRSQAFADIAAQFAHQLRQPLNNIRTGTTNLEDWLDHHGRLDDTVQKFTELIERNVSRMDDHIQTLRKVALGLRDGPVELNLGTCVQLIADRHQGEFTRKGIALQVEGCEDAPTVVFGKVAVEFILDNFLLNALAAASQPQVERGTVVIQVEKRPRQGHRVVVSDNGKGVPPELQDQLFKAFIRSDQGYGEGLFWSRVQAEEYGGILGCEAVEPSGAAFFVEFGGRGQGSDE